MRYTIRSDSLKRLFSMKRRSSINGDSEKESGLSEINQQVVSATTVASPKPSWKCFSYKEISRATSSFSSDNLVGRGGYAEVYRGVLESGEAIAVKRLSRAASNDERKEKEFLTEIGTIGHVNHPNVSSLLGFCLDKGLYLIFQFSSRGSVASLLHDEILPTIGWKIRYKIAVGTGRGLCYLHTGCQRRIIHRDITASNILLTADFEPQISDFGLAKWLPSQWTHHSIAPIEGTFGHLAPEYFMHGIVDEKTDVFAFGVFLLEIISGRKPVDGSHQSLHSWAKPILKQGEIEKLVDPRLGEAYNTTQLSKLAYAASLCIRASAMWRPTMTEDVTMKIISFSQQGPRAICILSANGIIKNVTLRQPDSSGGTLTYEGRFEILSLTGSFTPTESGGTRSRAGGLSVSLASPDGRVLGGGVAGLLVAASPVQVVVGSFIPSNPSDQKIKKL